MVRVAVRLGKVLGRIKERRTLFEAAVSAAIAAVAAAAPVVVLAMLAEVDYIVVVETANIAADLAEWVAEDVTAEGTLSGLAAELVVVET